MDEISETFEHLRAADKAPLEDRIEALRREKERVAATGSLEEIHRRKHAHFQAERARTGEGHEIRT